MSIISKDTWDNLIPAHEKEKVRRDYQVATETGNGKVVYELENLFGKENLQPQPMTYDDVARELFDSGIDEKQQYALIPYLEYNDKWRKKLIAIGKLLVIAKFLNKDWKPRWNYMDKNWYILVGRDEEGGQPINYSYSTCHISAPVYFRTEELAKQAVAILGEDTVRLALTTDF